MYTSSNWDNSTMTAAPDSKRRLAEILASEGEPSSRLINVIANRMSKPFPKSLEDTFCDQCVAVFVAAQGQRS